MQANSEKFSEFSARTEFLAKKIAVNLSDLPEIIEISASMFHAYRSGKYPISPKVWRKLQSAETAAGIVRGCVENDKNEESSSNVKEAGAEYGIKNTADPTMEDAFRKIREAVDILEALLKTRP